MARRPLRSPTNCAKALRAFSLRPPPPVSLRSCLRGRLSSLRGVLGPSPFRKDPQCSGRSSPRAYAKHLVALLGDAFLTGIALPRLIPARHKSQRIGAHAAALFEAVGIFQGEHEGQRGKRPDPLDLAQELGFWVVLFGDGFQLSVVFAEIRSVSEPIVSRIGPRAGRSASGTCSGALLWKLLAGPLGNLPPKDLTFPLTWFTSCVRQLTSASRERIKAM